MKRLVLVFIVALFFVVPHTHVVAQNSERAYQDYLYQFDVYRQKYNEFSIAKNEYLKFKTLASESAAITKTREMLSQRSQLLRAYLLLLTEKVNESSGMSEVDKNLYRTLMGNEIQFLENHSQFVKSIENLKDAQKGSEQLESHYNVLQISIKQTILGITLAKLRVLGDSYSERMVTSRTILDQVKQELPVDKHTILDRWFLQISNKRSLYLEKYDTIAKNIQGMKPQTQLYQIDEAFNQSLKLAGNARQDLKEGTSYLGELVAAMKYKD